MTDFADKADRISTERQEEILAEVARLIKFRSEKESQLREALSESQAASGKKYEVDFSILKDDFERESKELDAAYVKGLERARHRYEVDMDGIKNDCGEQSTKANTKYTEAVEVAELNWR